MRPSIALSLLLLVTAACDAKNNLVTPKFSDSGSRSKPPPPLISQKIDARKISIFDVSTIDQEINRTVAGSVNYDASEFTQWIEVKACDSTGKCIESTSVSQRISLPPFQPGPVEITMRGCIEKKYAEDPNVNCGSLTNTRYTQPEAQSSLKGQLYREEASRVTEIEKAVVLMNEAMATFAEDMKECESNLKNAIESSHKKNLVLGILNIGGILAGKAVSMFFKQDKLSGLAGTSNFPNSWLESSIGTIFGGQRFLPTFQGISTASDQLGGLASPVRYVKYGASALGLYQGGQPINAISAVGGALFDLFNADKLVPEQCTAKERYMATTQALKLKLESEQVLLQTIYKQLSKEDL